MAPRKNIAAPQRGKRNRNDEEEKIKNKNTAVMNPSASATVAAGGALKYQHHSSIAEILENAIKTLGITKQIELKERTPQIDKVRKFLNDPCDADIANQTLLLFGQPGTGKTAVVKHVLGSFPEGSTNHVILNGYVMQRQQEVFLILWRHLSHHRLGREVGNECTSEIAQRELETRFSTQNWGRGTNTSKRNGVGKSRGGYGSGTGGVAGGGGDDIAVCVIVVDEVDKCFEKSGKILFKLVDWASLAGSRCKLITMANSMQLPDRIDQKTKSRLNTIDKVIFPPYSADQLKAILRHRLGGTKFPVLTEGAENYVCNQIGRQNGDVRRLLQTTSAAIHSVLIDKKREIKDVKREKGIVSVQHLFQLVKGTIQDTSAEVVKTLDGELPLLLIALIAKQTSMKRHESKGRLGAEHDVKLPAHQLHELLNATLTRLQNDPSLTESNLGAPTQQQQPRGSQGVARVGNGGSTSSRGVVYNLAHLPISYLEYSSFVKLLEPLWNIQMCSVVVSLGSSGGGDADGEATVLSSTDTSGLGGGGSGGGGGGGSANDTGEGTECFWMYNDLQIILLFDVQILKDMLVLHPRHRKWLNVVFSY